MTKAEMITNWKKYGAIMDESTEKHLMRKSKAELARSIKGWISFMAYVKAEELRGKYAVR